MKTGQELWKEIRRHSAGDRLWWLGQMGFALRLGETLLLIDPYLSESDRRQIPPQLCPEDLEGVEWVLGTHDHSDHIDRPVWRRIAAAFPGCRFVLPAAHLDSVCREEDIPRERLVGLDDGGFAGLGGVTVTAVAAAHELLEPDREGRYPCLSYLLEWRGKKVLHLGDACLYEGLAAKLRSLGPFDVMIAPINGRDAARLSSGCIGNMTYQETADLCGLLRPGLCIPGHYDMFATNGENPGLFRDYLEVKYPGLACRIPCHGEGMDIL